jgi:DNA-binding SARP family transcriptional activator
MLWMEGDERHVAGSLRSALYQLRAAPCHVVETTRSRLCLATAVLVDWRAYCNLYRRVLTDPGAIDSGGIEAEWGGEFLPDWYEEWVFVERERFRQLRLHALEALSQRLAAAGNYWAAIEAGLAAVAAEPLRETAHRSLIQAHLREGNRSEAVAQFNRYRALLLKELGVEPSSSLRGMLSTDGQLQSASEMVNYG